MLVMCIGQGKVMHYLGVWILSCSWGTLSVKILHYSCLTILFGGYDVKEPFLYHHIFTYFFIYAHI
jgi:hypothetical protein